jgi:thimet oligopeptidase
VLDLFAAHHKTGDKIPTRCSTRCSALALVRARARDAAPALPRALDLEYHSRGAPVRHDAASSRRCRTKYDSFPYVEGTHFQSSFGHLVGYDAGYYGYQWALALSRDVLTRFSAAGLLDPKTAADYRARVLERGGSADADELVRDFLGRPRSDAAYKAFLVGGSAPVAKGPR